MNNLKCIVCNSKKILIYSNSSIYAQVSSDCKPVNESCVLLECMNCSFVFKKIDKVFISTINKIYSNYDVYYQGGGSEQIVFSEKYKCHMKRSDIISKSLNLMSVLPNNGCLIDIGCGNGSFLRSFGSIFNDWNLYGLELENKHEKEISSIANFKKLFVGRAEKLDGVYDLISLIHTLEHIMSPLSTLINLSKNLKKGGFLFIQVPDSEENPFDLIIADHVSHFSKHTLTSLLTKAGYEIIFIEKNWILKELCCLCIYTGISHEDYSFDENNFSFLNKNINYISNIQKKVDIIAHSNNDFGVFGTSIASSWLSTLYYDKINFYLDEDDERCNRLFFNKPVFKPQNAPLDSIVFMPMISKISESIKCRVANICPAQLLGPNDL